MQITALSKPLLTVVAETKAEAIAISQTQILLKDNSPELIDRINNADQTYHLKASRTAQRQNGGWHQVTVSTDYLRPYWEALYNWTGCQPFALNLMSALDPITFTGLSLNLQTRADGICLYTRVHQVFAYVGDWFAEPGLQAPKSLRAASYTFEERSTRVALKYIQDSLGEVIVQPEFTPAANGFYRRNPRYPHTETRQAVQNERVWQTLWTHWLTHFATEPQKALVAQMHTLSTNTAFRGPAYYNLGSVNLEGYTEVVRPEALRRLSPAAQLQSV